MELLRKTFYETIRPNNEFGNFRFRASELGNLLPMQKHITEKQRKELELLEKKEKLTARQEVRLRELREKALKKPSLSVGAKNWLELKFKDYVYNREREVVSKYMKKGTKNELAGIELANEVLGVTWKKYEGERLRNDYIEGMPDIVTENAVYDIKNSWDWRTFPLLDSELLEKKYYWQLVAYLWLTGKKEGGIVYVLTDLADIDIEKQIRDWAYMNDVIDVPEEIREKIYRTYRYDDIPPHWKVKLFRYNGNMGYDIEQIRMAVEEARLYLNTLWKKIEI